MLGPKLHTYCSTRCQPQDPTGCALHSHIRSSHVCFVFISYQALHVVNARPSVRTLRTTRQVCLHRTTLTKNSEETCVNRWDKDTYAFQGCICVLSLLRRTGVPSDVDLLCRNEELRQRPYYATKGICLEPQALARSSRESMGYREVGFPRLPS